MYMVYLQQIIGEVFKVNKIILYNLRMCNELYARNAKTVRYGTETISFLSPKIWALIPKNIKDSSSFTMFSKEHLENGNPTANVIYAKHICDIMVLYRSTEALPSQFLIYLKFYLFHGLLYNRWSCLLIFILHIVCKNYSFLHYLWAIPS